MSSDELILALARGLQPVTPLGTPSARLWRWLSAATGVLVVTVVAVGLRRDVGMALAEWRLPADTAMLGLTAVLAAAAALRLSVPGEHARLQAVAMLMALTWVATVWWGVGFTSQGPQGLPGILAMLAGSGWHCAAQQVLVAALSGGALVALVLRGATAERWPVALLTSVSAASVGALTSEWTCASSNALHWLVWHAGGSVFLVASGAVLVAATLARCSPLLTGVWRHTR